MSTEVPLSTLLLKLPWFVSAPLVLAFATAFAYAGYAFTGDYFHETCKNERNLLTGEFEASNCGEGAEVAARLAVTQAVIAVGSGQAQVVQAGVPSATVAPPPPSSPPTNLPATSPTAPTPPPVATAPPPSQATSAAPEPPVTRPSLTPTPSTPPPTATPAIPQPTSPPTSTLSPSPSPSAGVVASGSFRNGAPGHNGSGAVQAQRLADGKINLFLSNFSVTNGPDLYVVLSVSGDGDYSGGDLLVARLKANNGSQNYTLPDGIDIGRYRSVSIWCKSFDVVFAYAPLAVQ